MTTDSADLGSPGREALLRATVAVVAKGGLRSLTYRAVANEAKVTHGLVYKHFGSRDALIVAATEYSLKPTLDSTGYVTRAGTPGDFADGIPSLLDGEQDLIAFQYEVMLESRRRPELRDAVAALYANYRAATRQSLEEHGIDASADLATFVFAALDGIVLQGTVLQEKDVALKSVHQLQDLLARAFES